MLASSIHEVTDAKWVVLVRQAEKWIAIHKTIGT